MKSTWSIEYLSVVNETRTTKDSLNEPNSKVISASNNSCGEIKNAWQKRNFQPE